MLREVLEPPVRTSEAFVPITRGVVPWVVGQVHNDYSRCFARFGLVGIDLLKGYAGIAQEELACNVQDRINAVLPLLATDV